MMGDDEAIAMLSRIDDDDDDESTTGNYYLCISRGACGKKIGSRLFITMKNIIIIMS